MQELLIGNSSADCTQPGLLGSCSLPSSACKFQDNIRVRDVQRIVELKTKTHHLSRQTCSQRHVLPLGPEQELCLLSTPPSQPPHKPCHSTLPIPRLSGASHSDSSLSCQGAEGGGVGGGGSGPISSSGPCNAGSNPASRDFRTQAPPGISSKGSSG